MKLQKALTIAGSDSGGGAGIQADLKTFTALGVYGMTVITALTAQNTLGVQGIFDITPQFVGAQMDSIATDIGIDAVKTGMLSNQRIIEMVSSKVIEYKIDQLVVDPVMVAASGDPLLQPSAQDALLNTLIPLALVVTPNISEAEVLAGMKIASLEDMEKAAKIIRKKGVRNVIVKGGHAGREAVDVFYDGQAFSHYKAERIQTQNVHGTGCTFSAAITAELAKGKGLKEAIRVAKDYVTLAIRHSLDIGKGHGPTNHLAWIQN
jgi:hydroxymethylpyrimidine kinase/phosphomethylpyrimidine kinase